MRVEITQFIFPDGDQRQRIVEVPDDCAAGYEALCNKGCRLTAEVLTTGNVAQAISHSEGDYSFAITDNGPEVLDALAVMIRRFDSADFDDWLAALNEGCEFDEDGVAF